MERMEGFEDIEAQGSDDYMGKDSKRKKKTPLQIEMLEMAYAENSHPTETMRIEISSRLGLSNRQIQMWFCNRRLKDKKHKKEDFYLSSMQRKEEKYSTSKEPLTFYEYPEAVLALEVQDDTLFMRNACQQLALSQEEHISKHTRDVRCVPFKVSPKKKAQQTVLNIDPQAAARAILSSWGETFREDGPALGFEFDPLPPGAFGAPIEPTRDSSSIVSMEYQNGATFLSQGKDAVKCGGSRVTASGPVLTFRNASRDKQEELGRLKAYPGVRGGIELDRAHTHTGKRLFGMLPVSMPSKTLVSSPTRVVMKQDGYGYQSCLRPKTESSLIHPSSRKSSSNESIVSFIKQHEGSRYVTLAKAYHGNYSDGYSEENGFESDLQNPEDSDGEINMEAEENMHAEQVSKKQKPSFQNSYEYGHTNYHAYTKWNSAPTFESTGLIETGNCI